MEKIDNYLIDELSVEDPEIYELIVKEKDRQFRGLEMIASENFTSKAVQDCLSSCLTNKYSEGLIGNRYYGGNEIIDKIETIAQKRALEAFDLDPQKWGVNVQPYSGSPANFAVYTGLVEPHGRIMELIDYDQLQKNANLFKPKIIIAGISCYPRNLDYARFREICNECGALLMADMAHVSGLVAAKLVPSPFPFCDIVTTTTHKTLRGPRSGIIFFRKDKINQAVFPGLQGGPHNNQIAGVAVALKQAKQPSFRVYQEQVISNARTLASELQKLGEYKIVTGGTDTHIVWVNMKPVGLSGGKAEKILEEVSIACNKNTVPGDKSALNPSGIRFGTGALTTRGLKNEDIKIVANFIHRAVLLANDIQNVSGPKLADFKRCVYNEEFSSKIEALRKEVEDFASRFPLPGNSEF
ncbi:Thioredoxin domain-containing protein [Armadillidium vulgare]|nr:Thioredoxin domain-containing protein [Armadillidium vulgare]